MKFSQRIVFAIGVAVIGLIAFRQKRAYSNDPQTSKVHRPTVKPLQVVPNVQSESKDLNEILDLFAELSAEIDYVAKVLPDAPGPLKQYSDPSLLSNVERRLLIRSVFAFIETVSFRVKTNALLFETNALTPGEISLIKEEDYELADSGEVRIRNARLKLLNNFRFAFAVAAKAADVNFRLDVGGVGWQALRESIPVRDRLTHPKRLSDLIVTENEVRQAMTAFDWALRQMEKLSIAILLKRH